MKLSTLARNLNLIEAYLDKQESVLSAAPTPAWFKKLTREEQKDYFKEHPGSRFKPGAKGKKQEEKKSAVVDEKTRPLKFYPNLIKLLTKIARYHNKKLNLNFQVPELERGLFGRANSVVKKMPSSVINKIAKVTRPQKGFVRDIVTWKYGPPGPLEETLIKIENNKFPELFI